MSEEKRSWFDSITPGTVIVALCTLLPLVGTGYIVVDKVADISKGFDNLREDVNAIKINLAVKDGLNGQVQDHEIRIRSLEQKR